MTDRNGMSPDGHGPRRSKDALDRLLTTLDELLCEREFRDISLREIADVAEVSTASLYSLAPAKDDLLGFLHQRHVEEFRLAVLGSIGEKLEDGSAPSLLQLIRDMIRAYLGARRAFAGRIRAFDATRDARVRRRAHALGLEISRKVVELAGPHLNVQKTLPLPFRAFACVGVIRATVDTYVDYPGLPFELPGTRLSDDVVVCTLAEICLAYLQSDTPGC